MGILPMAGLRGASSAEGGVDKKQGGAGGRSPPAKEQPRRPQRLSVRQASRGLGLNPSEDAQNSASRNFLAQVSIFYCIVLCCVALCCVVLCCVMLAYLLPCSERASRSLK